MAEGDRSSRSSFDRNRDGVDDNVDRRPGNSGDSPEYARRYDPDSRKEYSNLLEPQDQLQAQEIQAAINQQRTQEALQAAQSDVHFFQGLGKFIIPAENTWAAHAQMVADNDTQLFFDTKKYAYFDKIIADKINLPALTDRTHPDFAKYKGLRTNLEVLRNDIIGMYLQDGGYDAGDEVYVPIITSIAAAIGDALANDVWWKRPFTKHFSLDVANVEAVGAAEIYKYLLRQQDSNQGIAGFFQGYIKGARQTFGLPERNWGLLPLEKTPFSPEALSAPPPNFEALLISKAGDARGVLSEYLSNTQRENIAAESITLVNTARQFKHIDELNVPAKDYSVEEARKILRALNNLQFKDMDVQDWLDTGTPTEQLAKAETLSQLVMIYAAGLTTLKKQNQYLLANADIQDGGDAAGAVAIMIGEHALGVLPEDSQDYKTLANLIDSMPKEHDARTSQSVERLLGHIERGLTQMSGQILREKTPVESLLEIRDRIQTHAKQLSSVETLQAPVREESVELGREILRKLKNLTFRDTSVQDAIDSGRPEEKLVVAQKIEELVDLYKNMLAEAATNNPDIMTDTRIQDANDAVSKFAHTIDIMAAKEIPNSMASSMGISSDATLDPKEWDAHLHENTINRLLTRIEGGLKKAVEEVEMQEQQEQQQDQQQAQEIIDAALQQADGSRRKKRRRKNQRSPATARAKKARLDLAADDASAGQNQFAEKKKETNTPRAEKSEKPAASFMGLDPSIMAAIKAEGSTLSGASKQVAELPTSNVSLAGSVAPNDKTAAELAIESIKNRGKNSNRPGV